MPLAHSYPKSKIEELIFLRLKSLLEANLLNKGKYDYLISQISTLKSTSLDIPRKEVITFGLLYQTLIDRSGKQVNKKIIPLSRPYDQNRDLEEISFLIDFLGENLSLTESNNIKNIFLEHFINYERNMKRLTNIREQNNFFNLNDVQRDKLTKFLNQIIKNSREKINIEELEPKEEESILALFEKKFNDYKDLLKFDENAIEWDESLIDRARKKLYSPLKDSINDKEHYSSPVVFEDKKLDIPIQETSSTVKENYENLDSKTKPEIPSPFQTISGIQPWDFVGKILVKMIKSDFEGIGILEWPVEDKSGKIFFPVNIEMPIELDQSDSLFREIQSLRVSGISDTSQSRQNRLKEEISDFLNIPENISLNPSLIKEYLAKRDVTDQVVIFKEKLLRTEFYPFDKISLVPEKDHWAIIKEKTTPRHHLNITTKVASIIFKQDAALQKKKLSLWTEETIGTVITQFSQNNNFNLLIEYDFPSKLFLENFIPKIKGYDPKHEDELWYLRFFVSKKLDGVFEGEALLPQNLWKFIWIEKIPILPFDLRSSFIGTIPSQSIDHVGNSVILKRNQEPNPLLKDETLSSFLKIMKQEKEIGSVIGFTLNDTTTNLEIIYSDLKPKTLFEKLGKDASNIEKLLNRIERALNIKEDESRTSKAIITYLTFYSAQFATYEDLSQYNVIESWLIKTFSLKKILYQDIKSIDLENKIILLD